MVGLSQHKYNCAGSGSKNLTQLTSSQVGDKHNSWTN